MNKIQGRWIAPEGRRIVVTLVSLLILFGMIQWRLHWSLMNGFLGAVAVLLLFCINFFRDPSRIVTGDERAIIAPADGKVIRIEKVDDPRVGPAWLVSIFLNIFNVHANRMPVEGTFLAVTHKPGKFLAAFDHAASDENEQTEILIQAPKGKVIVRQIAGLVARRILCYARENESMNRGDRLGFIMFGSRTDIIFPASVSLKIEVGQKTRGGETRIGEWT